MLTSPTPQKRGRPKKNPVVEEAAAKDESALFNVIKNCKNKLQVSFCFIFLCWLHVI